MKKNNKFLIGIIYFFGIWALGIIIELVFHVVDPTTSLHDLVYGQLVFYNGQVSEGGFQVEFVINWLAKVLFVYGFLIAIVATILSGLTWIINKIRHHTALIARRWLFLSFVVWIVAVLVGYTLVSLTSHTVD